MIKLILEIFVMSIVGGFGVSIGFYLFSLIESRKFKKECDKLIKEEWDNL